MDSVGPCHLSLYYEVKVTAILGSRSALFSAIYDEMKVTARRNGNSGDCNIPVFLQLLGFCSLFLSASLNFMVISHNLVTCLS